MKKVILNLAVSLDGFIARQDGSVDWLDDLDTDGSDLGYQEFLSRCDTIVMGRVSYEETLKLGNGTWPFPTHRTYVFTRKNRENEKSVFFINKNPIQFVENLRHKDGKDIWLFGGGDFIKTIRGKNLVDEYIITTIPVFLGNGIRLFQEINVGNNLQLLSFEKHRDIIQTHYIVI